MKTFKTTIEVEVSDIKVDDFYYSFEYKLTRNGGEPVFGSYENDHSWQGRTDKFKELLETEYAADLAINCETMS